MASDAPAAAAGAAGGAPSAVEEEQEPEQTPAQLAAQEAMRAKMRAIMAINNDASLSDEEKSRRRQDVMMGKWAGPAAGKENRAGGESLFSFFFHARFF